MSTSISIDIDCPWFGPRVVPPNVPKKLVVSYKWTGWVWGLVSWVWELRRITHHCRGIHRIYLKWMKASKPEDANMDLESLGSWPALYICPKTSFPGTGVIWLATANHKDCRFKFRSGVEMQKLQEVKVRSLFLFERSHNYVNTETKNDAKRNRIPSPIFTYIVHHIEFRRFHQTYRNLCSRSWCKIFVLWKRYHARFSMPTVSNLNWSFGHWHLALVSCIYLYILVLPVPCKGTPAPKNMVLVTLNVLPFIRTNKRRRLRIKI